MQRNDEGEQPSQGDEKMLVMVVLVGLVGSGKSSFAKALQEYYSDYVRCNQDTLGSRNAVKACALRALKSNQNVVIDRTNVDESQRATWIDLAKSLPNVEIHAFYFDTPLWVCKERLAVRLDHETIKDPAQALKILHSFHRDLVRPVHSEGFQRIISILPTDFASALPTKVEVDTILDRAAEAPLVNVPIVRTAHQQQSYRGRGRGYVGAQWQQMRGAAPTRGGSSPFYNSQRGVRAASENWRRSGAEQQLASFSTYSSSDRTSNGQLEGGSR